MQWLRQFCVGGARRKRMSLQGIRLRLGQQFFQWVVEEGGPTVNMLPLDAIWIRHRLLLEWIWSLIKSSFVPIEQ